MKPPRLVRFIFALAALVGAIFGLALPASAQPNLTVTPLTWNVVGLDSNNVNVGPNNFPVGARVCNTGDTAATNVSSSFVWDSTDTYINLRPGSLTDYTGAAAVASLAAGACHDFYYELQITRNAAAYNHARRYHLTATADGLGTSSTPTPREIYVEYLISQSRNSISDVKLDGVSIPAGGTMALLVGSTYNIELVGATATNGYEQIESFVNFFNTIFRVNSVATTYSANAGTDAAAATRPYADGCRWENDPNSPNYRSCLSVGKYGGIITVTYNVTIIGGGGTAETLNSLIYDFSGSSYHYNSDYSVGARIAAIIDPSLVTISKAFTPNPTTVGGTSTLTFTINNPNGVAISSLAFTDDLPTSPGAMVVANPTGATTSGCGTPTFSPIAGAASISFLNGTVAANSSCIIRVNVTAPVAGSYANTSGDLFIGTTDTGNSASASLTVNTEPPPPSPVCGLVMARWNFTGISNPPPQPAPSTQAPDVSTAAISVGGTSPGSLTDEADATSGNPAPSLLVYGWPNAGPINTATFPFIQFAIDASNYTQVNLGFDAQRKANGPNNDAVYFSTDGTTWTLKSNFASTTAWAGYGPYDFTGQTSTIGVTYFRIYGYGANTPSKGADLSLDNVSFTGCGTPNPPTITKSFSPNPVAVGGASSLSLTITNPNSTVALSGIQFTDTLPSGVTVATGSASACGGTLSRTAPSTIDFSGGTLAAGANCTMAVAVTVTTAGPHDNVSGYISATESGQNTGAGGSASASITAILAPSISKQFSPNPILTGGTSTLTFTLRNPNPNDQLTGVQFTDTLPTSPGNLVVANPTGASTSGCGTPAYAPVVGAGSISFSGGTIAAGGTCTVTVNVTGTITGDFDNTTGAVSATLAGAGNTASDILIVQPVHPGVSVLKQVSTNPSGPWTTFVGVTAGADIYYRFTVENTGDVPLTGVNVTDPALTGLGVDLSGCVWSSMPVYDLQTCVVGPVTAVSGSHSNSATAHATYSGSTYDSLPSTATYATTGLALEKSVAEGYFSAADDVLHYSYLITNSGSAPLAGPVSISDDQSADEACPAVSTVGDLDDFLDPGESITCTATYTVAAGDVTAGSVTNTASAEADGVTSNTDTQTVYVFLPQLSVSKSNDAGGNGSLGVSFSWTLTLANIGPVSATFADGQTITSDPLPSGATYGSATPGDFTNITNSGNISCSIDGSNVLTCAASGGSVTVGASTGSFTVTIDTTPAATGSLANTATVDPDDVIIEADEADNTGSDTVSVTAPGLTATKTNDAGGTLLLGGSFSWTIQVSSATGGSTGTATFASGEVVLRDNLPTGPSYGSVTITDGATAPGGSGSLNCSIASDTLTCSASGGSVTLPPSASFSASFSVTPTSAGDLTNPSSGVGDVCQVDPDGLISESDESNNDCADTVAVTSIAPPTIAKSFSPVAIAVGDTSTLTFTLANPSGNTVTLTGVDFSDTYPAGVQNDSPLTTTNTCGGGLTATAGGSSIALSGGSIPVDGNCQVTVVVTGTTAGTKDNTSGNVTSTNGGTGNTASDTLTVSEATFSDPAVTKTLDPASAQVGDTVTFTLVVTNEGTADATGVVVTDTIPSFLDIASVSVSPVGPSVTTTGNTITINVGTVTPSDVFTVTITTIVNNLGAPPGGTNQADLTSGSIDPDPANNTDSVSLAIVAASGLGAPETGFAPNRQTTLPVQPEAEAYENYGDLWLEIPSIGVEASILGVPLGPNGWDVTWLSDQAGYLAGTAFPTWTGNSVITGHATLPSGSAGPFARIQNLRYGDQIIVHAWGYRYNYEVREASLVRPSSPSIFRHEERAWVSLITCAGYDDAAGTYRWRQLVRAVLMRVETTNAIPAGGPRPARSK